MDDNQRQIFHEVVHSADAARINHPEMRYMFRHFAWGLCRPRQNPPDGLSQWQWDDARLVALTQIAAVDRQLQAIAVTAGLAIVDRLADGAGVKIRQDLRQQVKANLEHEAGEILSIVSRTKILRAIEV